MPEDRHLADAGFSLTEVIVAVFIAGLTLSFVLVSLPKASDPMEKAKDDLVAQLELARDLARTTGQAYGVDIVGDAVQTLRLEGREWKPHELASGTSFQAELPIQIELENERERRRAAKSRIGRDEEAPIEPEVWFDPAGIASAEPIYLTNQKRRLELSVARNGEVHVEAR